MSSTEALNSNGYDEHLPEEIVPNKNDITELQSNPESVDQIEQEEEKYEFPDVGKKTKMRGFGNKMKTILKLKTSKPDLSHAQTTPSTPIVLYTGINVWENVKVEESGSDSHGKTDGKQETSNRILAVEEKLIVDFEKAFQDFSQPENEEDSSEELEKVDGEVKFQMVYSEAKTSKYEESAMEETNRESFTFESDNVEIDAQQFDKKDLIEGKKTKGKSLGKKMKKVISGFGSLKRTKKVMTMETKETNAETEDVPNKHQITEMTAQTLTVDGGIGSIKS